MLNVISHTLTQVQRTKSNDLVRSTNTNGSVVWSIVAPPSARQPYRKTLSIQSDARGLSDVLRRLTDNNAFIKHRAAQVQRTLVGRTAAQPHSRTAAQPHSRTAAHSAVRGSHFSNASAVNFVSSELGPLCWRRVPQTSLALVFALA